MSAGSLPVDLILFGMIAVFLVIRLRSILGKRQGFEGMPEQSLRRAPGPVIDGKAEPAPTPQRVLPDPQSDTGRALTAMQKLDRTFSPTAFLSGAEGAFRLIVTAFAAGDRAKLRPLLAPATFAAFDQAITARDAAQQVQRTDIRSILEAAIEAASLQGTQASITVRYLSQQVAVTLGLDGAVVAGADAVMELVDVWTFVRDMKQQGSMWQLAGTHSA